MKRNETTLETLSVTWRTPLGPMTGQVEGAGVRALRFPERAQRTLEQAADGGVEVMGLEDVKRGGEEAAHAVMACVEAVTNFLQDYFAGRAVSEGPKLDYNGVSAFDRAVWEATRRIPHGRTKTYGEIAAEIGRPGAARAVGGALGRNPLVLLVPCHRVIASAGGAQALCGFTGGLDLKKYLLALEGIQILTTKGPKDTKNRLNSDNVY